MHHRFNLWLLPGLRSGECGGRAPHSKERIVDWFLASIAKCAATIGLRFTTLAGSSPPVLERTKSGAGRLRAGLSTS